MRLRDLASIIITATFCALAGPASAQVPDTLAQVIPGPQSGIQAGADLGSSVALDGNFAVVGAPLDDVGAEDAGVVKIFDSNTGELLYLLTNPSPAKGDHFGTSVAISGPYVVVGAPDDSPHTKKCGSAYVYDLNSADPTVPMLSLAPQYESDLGRFGLAVTISGDRLAIGAPGITTGLVYIYQLHGGVPGTPVRTLGYSDFGMNAYGASVAMSGSRLVVGAPDSSQGHYNDGRAFVYDLDSPTPSTPTLLLSSPGGSIGRYGFAVGISGQKVVIGEPQRTPAIEIAAGSIQVGAAHVYDLASPTPNQPILSLGNPGEYVKFGHAVSICGSRVVVGAAFGFNPKGKAYVYDLNGATPATAIAVLQKSTPAVGDMFGYGVAISSTHVLVGAPGDDTVLSAQSAASPPPLASGASLASPATAAVGPSTSSAVIIIVGPPYTPPPYNPGVVLDTFPASPGAAYVYTFASPSFTVPSATLTATSPASFAAFGSATAISGDLLVASNRLNHVYVYNLANPTPSIPWLELTRPDPQTNDSFGRAVAIDGNLVVVGAPFDKTGAPSSGKVYVYNLAGAAPEVPAFTIANPTPAEGDGFGASVAIEGNRVAIGAPSDDTGAANSGAVYVYNLDALPLTPTTFTPPGARGNEAFGLSVAVRAGRVFVGAPFADLTGSVYQFLPGGPNQTVPEVTYPSPGGFVRFGAAIAVGSNLVVGAPGDDGGAPNSGSAYVFGLGSPTPLFKLIAPHPVSDTAFGSAVASSQNLVVVGAYNSGQIAPNGSAFAFRLTGPNSYSVASLPVASSEDRFGASVAVDGQAVAIGAAGVNTGLPGNGAVRLFRPGTNTPPVVTLTGPAALQVEAGQPFTDPGATATDAENGALTPFISINTVLPNIPGLYSVLWTAADFTGLRSVAVRSVTVSDTTPPALTLPGDVVREATSPAGAVGQFVEPSATDVTGVASLQISHHGSDFFPVGTTTVTVRAEDHYHNVAQQSFTVTVRDTTPPAVFVPDDLKVNKTSLAGAVVNYPLARATDAVGVFKLECSHPSGSLFPIGTTTVTVTATDFAGNNRTKTFHVTVLPGSLEKLPPVITLTSPTSKLTSPLTISGTVRDDTSLQSLTFKLNGVPLTLDAPLAFTPATTLPWSISGLTPENGPNLLEITAVDFLGHTTTLRKTLSFENIRPELAGTYQALLRNPGPASNETAALLSVTVSPAGDFTGKLLFAGKTGRFTGRLDNQGVAQFSSSDAELPLAVPRFTPARHLEFSISQADGLQARLTRESAGSNPDLVGTAAVSNFGPQKSVPPALLTLNSRGALANESFNVIFPPKTQSSGLHSVYFPQGTGFIALTLTPRGDLVANGRLADGAKFSATSKLRSDHTTALFVSLYQNTGFACGELTFVDETDSDLHGTDWHWFRPSDEHAAYYPAGWSDVTFDPAGTKYARPSSLDFTQGPNDLANGNARLTLSEGLLGAPIDFAVNIDPATGAVRKIPTANPSYALSLNPATGAFTGSFLDRAHHRSSFTGLLLNKGSHRGGFGYFLGPIQAEAGQSGAVFLDPAGP